jgi:GR25 family glycosyltransferase involved in LPS biosynthesis
LVESQLNKLNIKNYEFIEAVDGACLPKINYNSKLKGERLMLSLIKRTLPLLNTEIACDLSHIKACERALELNERCIVLEDDVLITDNFINYMSNIDDKYDLVYFGYMLREINLNCKTILEKHIHENHIPDLDVFYRPDIDYIKINNNEFYKVDKQTIVYHTHAYSPSLTACKRIIESSKIYVPSDIRLNILKLERYCPKSITVYQNRAFTSSIGDRSEGN